MDIPKAVSQDGYLQRHRVSYWRATREDALATAHYISPLYVMAILKLILSDLDITSDWFFLQASYLENRKYIAT